MPLTYDFSKQRTDELQRRLRFHENDLTETMEEECRRLFLIQEIDAELKRRASA